MDEIILNLNLKYVLEALNMNERGELLTALFDKTYVGSSQAVYNVYQYIAILQQEAQSKKQHMRELSAKGVAARRRQKNRTEDLDIATVDAKMNQRLLRKEAKEKDYNKYNLNLFSFESDDLVDKAQSQKVFVPPTMTEVAQFIKDHELKVDAQDFVNFYESHGWMVGSTPIRSWQATLRLWHSRAMRMRQNERQYAPKEGDEKYWHELEQRVSQETNGDADILTTPVSLSKRQNVAPVLHEATIEPQNDDCSPFARFMRRVEKYDINLEKQNDK